MPRTNAAATLTFSRMLTADQAAALLASGDCGCPDEHSDTASAEVTVTTDDTGLGTLAAADEQIDPEAPAGPVLWAGTIVVEGELTGDGRYIEPGALRWESLPIPLRYAPVDTGGHQGAEVVGRILTIDRQSDGRITATGDFDTASEVGREAARQVRDGLTQGVSVDLDSVSFEVRVARELIEGLEEPRVIEEAETDDEGRVTVVEISMDDEVMATTDARIRAATIVAIPAFAEARIEVTEGEAPEVESAAENEDEDDALVAGAFPVAPPSDWFSDPRLDGPTPLTVTEDGRVYGHLAVWGTCHTAYSGQCVEPPSSPSGYSYFRTGSVLTAEGAEIATGRITLDTLHAKATLSAAQTIAHYEDTGRAVADVTAGEDAFGIWVSGALRSNVTEEQVRALRASPLSGDWRRIGGNLELVGALAVNVPGFPVPRPQGLVASGAMTTLVASGMLAPRKVRAPGTPGALSEDDLRYLKRLAARERRAEQEERAGIQSKAEALAAKVRATRAAALARQIGVQ